MAGQYPVSRPLYLYLKKAHVGVVPGIEGFLAELTAEKAWGEEGYLVDKGLIPMSIEEQHYFRKAAQELLPLSL